MGIKGKAASLLEEFKAFAFKGNIVDMAIGVIIGGAFGKIVTSFVNASSTSSSSPSWCSS